jgi:hypothetical protein
MECVSQDCFEVLVAQDALGGVHLCALSATSVSVLNLRRTRVCLHCAQPVSRPMDRLFIDFVGPLARLKWDNIAILVVADSFSRFVSFCPVRKITSQAVVDYL